MDFHGLDTIGMVAMSLKGAYKPVGMQVLAVRDVPKRLMLGLSTAMANDTPANRGSSTGHGQHPDSAAVGLLEWKSMECASV
jgi:hypothetical protein